MKTHRGGFGLKKWYRTGLAQTRSCFGAQRLPSLLGGVPPRQWWATPQQRKDAGHSVHLHRPPSGGEFLKQPADLLARRARRGL